MMEFLDLDRFPLDRPSSRPYHELLQRCRHELEAEGMFNLEGLLRPDKARAIARELIPVFAEEAYTHAREHNIYFEKSIAGLDAGHPALARFVTVNHTLCGDQLAASAVTEIYEWPPLATFLAAVMEKPQLHTMADPLARVNVMAYGEGEALNWHFDRSEFTTTLLLQACDAGGAFEYRRDLRSDHDPNFNGVARLLEGKDAQVRQITLKPGTLNVFKGNNTAHRVTPVVGKVPRMVAVFSYYERPGVRFTAEEQVGFYGRSENQ